MDSNRPKEDWDLSNVNSVSAKEKTSLQDVVQVVESTSPEITKTDHVGSTKRSQQMEHYIVQSEDLEAMPIISKKKTEPRDLEKNLQEDDI